MLKEDQGKVNSEERMKRRAGDERNSNAASSWMGKN